MCISKKLSEIKGVTVTEFMQMKNRLSMGAKGYARYYITVSGVLALKETIDVLKSRKIPYRFLGNGTNVIVSDLGYNGAIVSLKSLNDIFFTQKGIKAMAGANLISLIDFAKAHNLGGIESLCQIPSSVGGAVINNCGAFCTTVGDFISQVETLKGGKIKVYDKNDCKFAYRTSRFKGKNEVIVSATFSLLNRDGSDIENTEREVKSKRLKTQPNQKSCGCIFKNKDGISSGYLIEKANLKGARVGGACVSDIHANFIVNDRDATASDVYALSKVVKDTVKQKFGIDLEYEVEFIGDFR